MQYSVTHGEKGKVEVKVDIPKAAFEEAYSKVLAILGKDAKIAGFRPGMAPSDVVENHIGHTKILNETASFLISKHLEEVLKKEKLSPLDSPKIAVHSLSYASPFSFTVSFTQKPILKLDDWKKIKVSKTGEINKITDNDVDESIKNIFEAWKKQRESQRVKESRQPGGQAESQSGKEPGTSDQKPGTKFIY